uniref:Uncharacterized protein n=1 Tax=Candidatus Aramenus sulfurataquae TaxID=1326980 RepID=A0A0F2LNQ3_9CREN
MSFLKFCHFLKTFYQDITRIVPRIKLVTTVKVLSSRWQYKPKISSLNAEVLKISSHFERLKTLPIFQLKLRTMRPKKAIVITRK